MRWSAAGRCRTRARAVSPLLVGLVPGVVVLLDAVLPVLGRLLGVVGPEHLLAAVALVVPVIHEFHFFCIHRLIHTPFLYKWVHSVHHNSVNPSPWSSLSMHPVEHLLYFATAFYHLILPSNPILMLYQLHYAGFGAIPGHVGFDKVEVGEETLVDSHAYAHYLHHKYFEVNYGDALIPLDRWFGTWHDGSAEGEARMQERYRKRKEKLAARKARNTIGEAAE